MTWEDAMWNYGNDKPDIRFGMKILNLKSAFKLGGELTGYRRVDQRRRL